MQNIVETALKKSGLNRRELARRAGVAASTVTRIERGLIDPSLGTAERILYAAGLQLPAQGTPLCDLDAIRAARAILSDMPVTEETAAWADTLRRWSSPMGEPNPRGLARDAGRAAPPRLRVGAITIRTEWNLLRVFSAAAATREGWAVSGAPAAARIGAYEIPAPAILYSEHPKKLSSIIRPDGAGSTEVVLLPFDGYSEAGALNDEGIVWADPLQIIMDCYGMPETTGLAEELTAPWEAAVSPD